MLFGIKYIGIEIENFHNALEYFFYQLDLNLHQEFTEDLFPVEFRPNLYKYKNKANGYKNFVAHFVTIFTTYKSKDLTNQQRKNYCNSFSQSNKIQEICNDISKAPVHSDDLPSTFQTCSKSFLSLYQCLDDIINRDEHFRAFKSNNGKVCFICGLDTIKPYDHFFPQGAQFPIYPFSAINPRNLVPICQTCNGLKSSKLIIFKNNLNRNSLRVITFYPYENFNTWEYLKFDLTNIDLPTLANNGGKWKVSISLKGMVNANQKEKINLWKEFYDIENRYSKDLPTNISIWINEFKEKQTTLKDMAHRSKPSQFNIKIYPSIILQSLFFNLIESDKNLRKLFINDEVISIDPGLLLNQ